MDYLSNMRVYKRVLAAHLDQASTQLVIEEQQLDSIYSCKDWYEIHVVGVVFSFCFGEHIYFPAGFE